MRGKKAKAIRQLVYGSDMCRTVREYNDIRNREKIRRDPITKEVTKAWLVRTRINTGLRRVYLDLKASIKPGQPVPRCLLA